jgi:hypothetical protein
MWKHKPSERLAHWRDFRKHLSTLPLETALAETAEVWQTCPFAPYYLDAENYTKWPDPWTLIEENYYCDLAKALGMLYTIYLTDHKIEDIEIRVYYDKNTKYNYNLVWINQGKYILNLIDGAVVNKEHIEKMLEPKFKYGRLELNLNSY